VSRVLRPAQHIAGHFRDESFQAITCTYSKQEKIHQKHKVNKQEKHAKTLTKLMHRGAVKKLFKGADQELVR